MTGQARDEEDPCLPGIIVRGLEFVVIFHSAIQ